MTNICDAIDQDNDRQKCEDSMNIMKALLKPFDYVMSNMQGIYIRDHAMNNLLDDVFKSKFGFNFNYIEIRADKNKSQARYDDFSTYIGVNENDLDMGDLIDALDKLKEDNKHTYTYIYFTIPWHVNAHILRGKDVYIYEPHGREYNYVKAVRRIYEDKGFVVKDMPKYIMIQKNLPMCYMYVVNFFLSMITHPNSEYKKYIVESQRYTESGDVVSDVQDCDDMYIMKFTRDMLKLLKEYEFITEWRYILLTNNVYALNKFLDRNVDFSIDLSTELFQYITNVDMVDVILRKCRFSQIYDFNDIFINLDKYYRTAAWFGSHCRAVLEELCIREYMDHTILYPKLSLWNTHDVNGKSLTDAVMKKYPSEFFLQNELNRVWFNAPQYRKYDGLKLVVNGDRDYIAHLKTVLNRASIQLNLRYVEIVLKYINSHYPPEYIEEILSSITFDFLHLDDIAGLNMKYRILGRILKQKIPPVVIDKFLFSSWRGWSPDMYEIIMEYVDPVTFLKHIRDPVAIRALAPKTMSLLCDRLQDIPYELLLDMKNISHVLNGWVTDNLDADELGTNFPGNFNYFTKRVLPGLVEGFARVKEYSKLIGDHIAHLCDTSAWKRTNIDDVIKFMEQVNCIRILEIVNKLTKIFYEQVRGYDGEKKYSSLRFKGYITDETITDALILFRKMIDDTIDFDKYPEEIKKMDAVIHDIRDNAYSSDYDTTPHNVDYLLIRAVKNKYIANVRMLLLEENVNVNYKNPDGRTPIYYALVNAIHDGDYKIVRMLVDANCQVSQNELILILHENAKDVPDDILKRITGSFKWYHLFNYIINAYKDDYSKDMDPIQNHLHTILGRIFKMNDDLRDAISDLDKLPILVIHINGDDYDYTDSDDYYYTDAHISFFVGMCYALLDTFNQRINLAKDRTKEIVHIVEQSPTDMPMIDRVDKIRQYLDGLAHIYERTEIGIAFINKMIAARFGIKAHAKTMALFTEVKENRYTIIDEHTFTTLVVGLSGMFGKLTTTDLLDHVVEDIFKNIKYIYLHGLPKCWDQHKRFEYHIKAIPYRLLWRKSNPEHLIDETNPPELAMGVDEFTKIYEGIKDRVDAFFVFCLVRDRKNEALQMQLIKIVDWIKISEYLTKTCPVNNDDRSAIDRFKTKEQSGHDGPSKGLNSTNYESPLNRFHSSHDPGLHGGGNYMCYLEYMMNKYAYLHIQ